MVAIDNAGSPVKELACHLRRILSPLFMAATVIGASVRHRDKRVMAVRCVYFVLANAFLLALYYRVSMTVNGTNEVFGRVHLMSDRNPL
jgi:hypothetical protein